MRTKDWVCFLTRGDNRACTTILTRIVVGSTGNGKTCHERGGIGRVLVLRRRRRLWVVSNVLPPCSTTSRSVGYGGGRNRGALGFLPFVVRMVLSSKKPKHISCGSLGCVIND
jgi:hypothetical protein